MRRLRSAEPGPSPTASALSVTLALLAFLPACSLTASAGRSFAGGAIEEAAARESTLVAMERRLSDSAGAFLEGALRRAAIGPVLAAFDSMSVRSRAEVDSLSAGLASGIREHLGDALREVLTESFDVMDTRASQFGRTVADATTAELERGLASALGTAADTLAHRLVDELVLGLQDRLKPTLHTLMREVTDSLRARVGDVDRSVSESSTVSRLRALVLVAGSALFLLAGLALLMSWRRHRRALHAVLEAIELADDEDLRRTVGRCAGEAQVEGWLASKVVSRRRRRGPSPPFGERPS